MQYWHAIYSTPNGEGRACLGIEAAGYKAFYPVERLRYRLHRQTEATGIFIKSLFPRYLFAQFDAGRDHGAILEIDGVHEVLRQGNSILRVPEMAIEAMRHAQEVGMFDRSRRGSAFVPGESVNITAGPFAGFIATIRSAPSKRRVQVMVDFLGKSINASVNTNALERRIGA